jgi:hypothetical protein
MGAETVIMYLWTVPASTGPASTGPASTGQGNTGQGDDGGTARRASGVTDSASNARQAAEALLRNGQAGSAYIECAYTAMATRTLSLCYVRTGSGWSGQLGQAGQVVWTPFSAQCSLGQPGTPGQSPWPRYPRPAR